MDCIPFGERYDTSPAPESLRHDESRRLFEACLANKAFRILELRKVELVDHGTDIINILDAIIVDCADGTFPSKNKVGIKPRERLALIYYPSDHIPYHVWAIRRGFPDTLHQNHMPQGYPASLCLYFESWPTVERTWTPEKHLQRVLWWLRETANGTLHNNDQPLEQFYFESEYEVVLPHDFTEKSSDKSLSLKLDAIFHEVRKFKVIRASFVPRENTSVRQKIFADFVSVAVPPINHSNVERFPSTLSELQNQLERRGSSLIEKLKETILDRFPETGLNVSREYRPTLHVLSIPRLRENSDNIEKIDVRGFLLNEDIASVGIKAGILMLSPDGNVFKDTPILTGDQNLPAENNDWRNVLIKHPVDIKFEITKGDARLASGVPDDASSDFQGLLAGVGALGSVLADLWSREGWGNWTYVDDDILKAHNIVRHSGKDCHIGLHKVNVVADLVSLNYSNGLENPKRLIGKISDPSRADIQAAVTSAKLFVDATTTLNAPRDLASLDTTPRSASVFLTPSGKSSVLLLEDSERKSRLDHLEAQYYRAILNSEWGDLHLEGHYGGLIVGGGCRDVSAVISNELVQLHGAILARQVRTLSTQPKAHIRVWNLDDETCAIATHLMPVHNPIIQTMGEWTVVWDEGLRRKLFDERASKLPSETGGVLLGYFDLKLNTIFIVDTLPAPPDSKADGTGFTRGKVGLNEHIEKCAKRTAYVVGYVGDWHSHPPHSSAKPSVMDIALLSSLANGMALDGLPSLMMIVGEGEISIMTGSACKK